MFHCRLAFVFLFTVNHLRLIPGALLPNRVLARERVKDRIRKKTPAK
jgi:hypothetical protein